jgi:hypothetical protein
MKNIHLIPTPKPSRIYLIKSNNKLGITSNNPEFTENFGSGTQNQNIYITSDEEIKDGDWGLSKLNEVILFGRRYNEKLYKKIILTTDQDLIKDGVQAIDDEFLEWFVKNPSCEEVKVDKNWNYPLDKSWEYKLRIIPQEEHPNQIKCYCGHTTTCDCSPLEEPKQETLDKKYTEEDMIKFAFDTYCYISGIMKVPFNKVSENRTHAEDNFKEYIKSLNKQDKWETYT